MKNKTVWLKNGFWLLMAAVQIVFLCVVALRGGGLLIDNDAGKVCIFNSLSPVFGTFLSILILGEDSFQLRYLISLVLVCGGVYLVNRTVKKG